MTEPVRRDNKAASVFKVRASAWDRPSAPPVGIWEIKMGELRKEQRTTVFPDPGFGDYQTGVSCRPPGRVFLSSVYRAGAARGGFR